MRSAWVRRMAAFSAAGVMSGLMAVGVKATPAFAVDCAALGGAIAPGPECLVPAGVHVVPPGAYTVNETLHLDDGAIIDARFTGVGNPPPTFSVTITSGDLLMDKGAQILTTDTPPPNDAAGDIMLSVPGNVVMQSDSRIYANNDTSGGTAGDITITVGGNMTMCGVPPAPPQPAVCGAAAGTNGALISSQWNGGGGNPSQPPSVISITVGDLNTVTGDFFLGGGTTGYMTETGAKITANSDKQSGVVLVTAGGTYFSEPGSVVESGDGSGTDDQQGGKIYVLSGCELTSEGRITSKGSDPGADLVHLEGCEVTVRGLTESTGKGHNAGARNNCDDVDDGLPTEVLRPGKPANSTACVEVWGNKVTVDSTSGWTGELNADIGNGGTAGTSWIDVFGLCCDVTILDGTGNDRVSDNGGGTYTTTFAVHANSIAGSDSTPNTVTVLSCALGQTCTGMLSGTGDTLQAAVRPPPASNGSDGGVVIAEATNGVNFDNGRIAAFGDVVGGPPCPSGSGACGDGGRILVTSYLSSISWQNGDGNADPNNPVGVPIIGLTACGGAAAINTTGTNFHNVVPTLADSGCVGGPTLPAYVPVQELLDRWARCGLTEISGQKRDTLTDAGLDGWTINIYGPNDPNALLATTVTAGGGFYSFAGLAPGTYVICEVLQAGYVQTFPVAGPGVVPCTHAGEAPLGYQVTVGGSGECCEGTPVVGKDFENNVDVVQPPECQKKTVTNTMNSVYPLNNGPDITVQAHLGGSVQDAVDNVTDTNGDGYLIVMVVAKNGGLLGGSANQSVVVHKDYGDAMPFALFGCSVTLTGGGGGPAVAVAASANSKNITVNGRTTDIFVMDLHGGKSAIGVQVEGQHRYLRNEYGDGNGVGIRVLGDNNTVHNGRADKNTENGVEVVGNGNLLTDVNAMSNGGNGYHVTGHNNLLVKLDAGDKNKGNGQSGVVVAGSGNQLNENRAKENAVGFTISGGTNVAPNALKKNQAKQGTDYALDGWVRNNGGGNKADDIEVPKTTIPTKCVGTFPAKNVSTSFAATNCG